MTNVQFDRWKDFALRMARTCYRRARRPSAKWIEGVVEDFFGRIDEADIPTIIDWDNSTEYPPGNPHYGRESQLSYCGCGGTRLWEGRPSSYCGECRGSGLRYRPFEGPIIGDSVTELLYEYEPRRPECRVCRGDDEGGECRCDEIEQLWGEQWDEQWGGPVHCCIRAGLDCASAPSMGVMGFTAGDVRRMYPEGVPDWVFPPNEQLHYWLSDKVNGTFAELLEETEVVL